RIEDRLTQRTGTGVRGAGNGVRSGICGDRAETESGTEEKIAGYNHDLFRRVKMQTLIRNGRVVTAVDDYHADILIEDGKVAVIGKHIDVKADKKIDAKGRLVIPGGIDPHT